MKNKTAVVTGATKGIGRAIAEALAKSGYNVVIAARHADACEQAAREIAGKYNVDALGVKCDVSKNADCINLIDKTIERFGSLHILINNAGIGGFDTVENMSPEHWDSVIGTNLNGLFYCTHAALPHLKRAAPSYVINIGSLAGKNPFARGSAYNASKFGLIGFSEALMLEVRQQGVRVSYIMPGSVATDFDGSDTANADWMIQPQDIAQIVVDLLDMPERTLPSRVEVRPTAPRK